MRFGSILDYARETFRAARYIREQVAARQSSGCFRHRPRFRNYFHVEPRDGEKEGDGARDS